MKIWQTWKKSLAYNHFSTWPARCKWNINARNFAHLWRWHHSIWQIYNIEWILSHSYAFDILRQKHSSTVGPFSATCHIQHLPSVLWHCWFGIRKSIRPAKIEWWGVGVVICLKQGADCLHMVQSVPLHPRTPSSLASKSRLVLPFCYWLNQVILEKMPLNRCSSSSHYRPISH